mmetsp:Transcript_11212/g.33789  ORF Transcript_11212/g.33789 Transcript_11212/m.33789 type:complete len:116 (+) Transcript_11212:79-426(+)
MSVAMRAAAAVFALLAMAYLGTTEDAPQYPETPAEGDPLESLKTPEAQRCLAKCNDEVTKQWAPLCAHLKLRQLNVTENNTFEADALKNALGICHQSSLHSRQGCKMRCFYGEEL